ncbi:MAG: glycyl-radical enzyme activating protein [Erysipelotrichaceae bacterium]|nr:glycyl-radical enzyme activating protein [Erysipelotrichaceae bacterium]
MKGFINKIQHYSTKDGPGIRSTVFMVGCNLRCLWCCNPESMLPGYKLMYHGVKCQRCLSCVQAFPEAVTMSEQGCVINREKADFDRLTGICPFDAYEKMGEWIEAEELVGRLLRYREFYEGSRGGVTFSGGECLLQSEFVEECMDLLHENGIEVCIDTAGNLPWDQIKEVLGRCDTVLFDLKAFDDDLHQRLTSVSNKLILENLSRLDRLDKELYVRMIIVPGLNEDINDLKARVDRVRGLQSLRQIDFLKYHKLGVGKYRELGLRYPLENIGEVSEELLAEIREYAGDIVTTVGG